MVDVPREAAGLTFDLKIGRALGDVLLCARARYVEASVSDGHMDIALGEARHIDLHEHGRLGLVRVGRTQEGRDAFSRGGRSDACGCHDGVLCGSNLQKMGSPDK